MGDFVGVKAGLSQVYGGAIAGSVILLVGNTVTRLIFGSLGQVAWSYVVFLQGLLSVAGGVSALGAIRQSSRTDRVTQMTESLSAALTGGLIGFFYGGSATHNNAEVATIGAIAGAISMLLISVFVRQMGIRIAIAAAGFTHTYGAAFLLGATASVLLSTRHFVWGIFFTVASLPYLWLTLISLKQVINLVKQAAGTSSKTPI
jgi:hypothetical protein